MNEREATYKTATDLYVRLVREMGRVQKDAGTSAYRHLPSTDEQARHVLAIAQFLTANDSRLGMGQPGTNSATDPTGNPPR